MDRRAVIGGILALFAAPQAAGARASGAYVITEFVLTDAQCDAAMASAGGLQPFLKMLHDCRIMVRADTKLLGCGRYHGLLPPGFTELHVIRDGEIVERYEEPTLRAWGKLT